jgi:hypothetical protein
MIRFLLLFCITLAACAPRVNYSFEATEGAKASELIEPFRNVLERFEIRNASGVAYRYDGNDEKAFLVAADRFYAESPGFCPLQSNAFHYLDGQAVFMTIAAKKTDIRLFVYDRSKFPQLIFAYYTAVSAKQLEVTPCRTMSSQN